MGTKEEMGTWAVPGHCSAWRSLRRLETRLARVVLPVSVEGGQLVNEDWRGGNRAQGRGEGWFSLLGTRAGDA